MIQKVKLKYFKRFENQEFDLKESIILAGTNNSGKTTLLQAIAVWNLALTRWRQTKGDAQAKEARGKARPGIPITRKDFTAIPLREMNLLWHNTRTAYSRDELAGHKAGSHKLVEITLEGVDNTDRQPWDLGFSLRYDSTEQIYATPYSTSPSTIPPAASQLRVVHVPPFSGIGAEETRFDREYQDLLIGQGKPGDILRNLLLEVSKSEKEWSELESVFGELFGYKLFPPQYLNSPYILCEYLPKRPSGKGLEGVQKLDIASAGSGMHQVLILLGFFFARPASILLLDEPDAHLHVVLQKSIYDRLYTLATKRGCQLVIATHSEVFIDGTDPSKILSFFRVPHILLSDSERDRVREAIRRLTNLDILFAEQGRPILYLEGESDFNILKAFAAVLDHPLKQFFNEPFWHSNRGRSPQEAKGHLFGLRAVNLNVKGALLLDGDNRNLPDREVAADELEIRRWKRYEIESYLLHPAALVRSVETGTPDLFSIERARRATEYLRENFPADAFNNPLGNNAFLVDVRASKTILPDFFRSLDIDKTKNEYFEIAASMKPNEVHQDVKDMLDSLQSVLL